MKEQKKVYGVGVYDMVGMSNTPEYIRWSSMLKRCYDTKWIQQYRPTYINASVCNQWLIFSNYYAYCKAHYFYGAVLDKDILVPGNKLYSPTTCVFVPEDVNLIVVCNPSTNRLFGVTKNKNSYTAKITINKTTVNLGKFPTEESAHREWQSAKAQHFIAVATDYEKSYPSTYNVGVYNSLLMKASGIIDEWENNTPTNKY